MSKRLDGVVVCKHLRIHVAAVVVQQRGALYRSAKDGVLEAPYRADTAAEYRPIGAAYAIEIVDYH